MEIFKTHNNMEAMQYAFKCLTSKTEGLDAFFNETLFLQTGITETSNIEKAKAMNIPVWKAEHIGGSILCFPGDVSLCMTHLQENNFGETLISETEKFLLEQSLPVNIENNDVLIDGKKVASWARGTALNGVYQTVAHFSVNIDLNLIKMLCTKSMEKIPGQLSDYGITTEILWKMIEERVLPFYI